MMISNTLHSNYFGQHVGFVIITTITSQQQRRKLNYLYYYCTAFVRVEVRGIIRTEIVTIGNSHKVVDPRKKWEKTPDINYTAEWWWESKGKPIGKAPSDIKKKEKKWFGVRDSARCVRERRGGSETVCLWGY